MFYHSSEVILQHESDQLVECITKTCSRCIQIQEQTGQTLDGYWRMKVSANKPINHKYKYKYVFLLAFVFVKYGTTFPVAMGVFPEQFWCDRQQ